MYFYLLRKGLHNNEGIRTRYGYPVFCSGGFTGEVVVEIFFCKWKKRFIFTGKMYVCT